MKKPWIYFMPIFFGLICFGVYILLYHPPFPSSDFITALFVFGAGVASSSMIILGKEKKRLVYYSYSVIVVIAFIAVLIVFDTPLRLYHIILFGLIVFALVFNHFFVGAYYRYHK